MDMAAHCRRFVWTQWEDSGFLERVNHSVTSCNEDGRRSMFAIAGFQGRGKPIEGRHGREQWNDLGDTPLDILQLDVDSRQWTTVYPTTDDDSTNMHVKHEYKPFGRYAHSCCWYKGKIYLYGGRNDVQFCDGVDCYDTNDRTWSQLKTFTDTCETPAGRYAHICALNGPVMYVQGGTTLANDYNWLMYTADVLSLNLETLVWKEEKPSHDLDLQKMPLARDFHSGVYIDSSLIIFGGKCPVPNQDDNRFYKFNLATHEWTILKTSGYAPEGRRSLSAVKFGDSHIIYFGGFSTTLKKFLSDLFILNTESLHVTKIVPYGMGPSPRRRAGMCLIGTELIICGGVGHKPVDEEIDNSKDKTAEDEEEVDDKKIVNSDKKIRQLMTFGDMYILHLVPSLQDLCIIRADQYKLDLSLLPSAIRRTQATMSLIYPDADSI